MKLFKWAWVNIDITYARMWRGESDSVKCAFLRNGVYIILVLVCVFVCVCVHAHVCVCCVRV